MATLIENATRIYTDKENIKQAIIDKGVSVPDGTSLDDYAELISQIESGIDTSDATASEDNLLSGYTAYVNGTKVTGNMPDQGTKTATLDAGDSYIIPEGYHNGSGKISAKSLAEQTDGTAVAGDILSGKTAYVDGVKVTGNIASKAAQTYIPGTSNQTIAAGQYLSDTQTIAGDADLVAANIVTGKNIFNVAGTFSKESSQPIAAANVLSGKIGFVNGTKVTGNMPNYSGSHIWVNTDNGTFDSNLAYTWSSGTTTNTMHGFKSGKSGFFDSSTKFIFGEVSSIAPLIAANKSFIGVTGTYTSDATATAAKILSGYTAYVNGSKITGTIKSKGAQTYTPGTSNQTIAAGQYLSGTQTIKGDANLKADNIKSGTTIFGVKGTYVGADSSKKLSRRDFAWSKPLDSPDYALFCGGKYKVALGSGNASSSNPVLDVVTLNASTGAYVNRANVTSLTASAFKTQHQECVRLFDEGMEYTARYVGTLATTLTYGGCYYKLAEYAGMLAYRTVNDSTGLYGAVGLILFRINFDGSITLGDSLKIIDADTNTNSYCMYCSPSLGSKYNITCIYESSLANNCYADVKYLKLNISSLRITFEDIRAVTNTDGTTTYYKNIRLGDYYVDNSVIEFSKSFARGDKNFYLLPRLYVGGNSSTDKWMNITYVMYHERHLIGTYTMTTRAVIDKSGVSLNFSPICPVPGNPDQYYVYVGGSSYNMGLSMRLSYFYGYESRRDDPANANDNDDLVWNDTKNLIYDIYDGGGVPFPGLQGTVPVMRAIILDTVPSGYIKGFQLIAGSEENITFE